MIELAPRHKFGLSLRNPVMPAAGVFGYGDAYRDLVAYEHLGAIVTNPVSLRPRHAARGQRLGQHGDHLLVHTGLPNAGLRRTLREYRGVWARSPVPVIVHLIATTPGETGRAAARLAGVQGVAGLELGLDARVTAHKAAELVAAACGELPLLARVPFGRVAELAPLLVDAGADALTLTAPPRAVLPLHDPANPTVARYLRGRLYGPALFPLLLEVLATWCEKLAVPVVACGGIAAPGEAMACLNLGAAAVQIDVALWREPALLSTIAALLAAPSTFTETDLAADEEDDTDKGNEADMQGGGT